MEKVLKEHSEYGLHGEGLRHSIYVVERNKIELQFRTDPNVDIEKYDDTLVLVYFVGEGELQVFEDRF